MRGFVCLAEKNIVTHRPIVRQRFGKHIPAESYARSDRSSIVRQWISKQAFSTIVRLCFLRRPAEGLYRDKEDRLN
jgi:hypothetical protein